MSYAADRGFFASRVRQKQQSKSQYRPANLLKLQVLFEAQYMQLRLSQGIAAPRATGYYQVENESSRLHSDSSVFASFWYS